MENRNRSPYFPYDDSAERVETNAYPDPPNTTWSYTGESQGSKSGTSSEGFGRNSSGDTAGPSDFNAETQASPKFILRGMGAQQPYHQPYPGEQGLSHFQPSYATTEFGVPLERPVGTNVGYMTGYVNPLRPGRRDSNEPRSTYRVCVTSPTYGGYDNLSFAASTDGTRSGYTGDITHEILREAYTQKQYQVETNHGTSPSTASTDHIFCEICHNSYSGEYRKGNLARHKRQKHGPEEQKYPCEEPGCDLSFKRQDARLKHYRKQHPDRAHRGATR